MAQPVPTPFAYNAVQPWNMQPDAPAQGPAPTSPFALPTSVQNRLAAPRASVTPAAAVTTPAASAAAATPPSPAMTSLQGVAGITALGAQAGSPAASAYDTKSGVVSTLGAAASGAASGALIGSVVPGVGTAVGALVGGGIGALTGGLNAYLSVGAANKAKRDQERLLRDAEAKQNRRDQIARDDAVSQLAYDRKQADLQKKWAKSLQVRQAIGQLAADDVSTREKFIATGRV